MFNNGPIILEGFGAAVFIAGISFVDEKIDTEYVPPYLKTKIKRGINGSVSFERNPKYPYKTREEEREARYIHEQKRRDYTIAFLQENYPETDYAERFAQNNKWNNPLRYHNEETKDCEFLEEDGTHCKKKRESTTCYTCCFTCTFPEGHCDKGECSYIK